MHALTYRTLSWGAAALGALLFFAADASAQERVLLQEVLPALEGSELGLLELGDAPPPGTGRVVRRSEVLAALRDAGRSSQGLAIPRATRVERRARVLDRAALAEVAAEPLADALSPCRPGEVRYPDSITMPSGPMTARVDGRPPLRTGSVPVVLILEASGRETRVSLRADVECPPPAIQPGTRLRLMVQVGNVVASAPGEARQSARIGDTIRVTNLLNRRTTTGVVIDENTVALR